MLNPELLEIIDKIDVNLKEFHSGKYSTPLEEILAKLSKITEEVGELNSEIMKKFFSSRNKVFSQENLELEFADIIITTLLLAKTLNVDVNKSLENKINIIKNRGGV